MVVILFKPKKRIFWLKKKNGHSQPQKENQDFLFAIAIARS